MITSVTLKNFRQHEDLHLEFSDGIQVIRGNNEAGKSTVFEAVSYALFGIRSCRNSDITSWGKPANSVAVSVNLNTGGRDYLIRRSPRGAEVNYDGGRVSGQTEVTRFCEEILNLKAGTGSKLMFAGQNAMRGVLSEGGAKTAQMIEQLAGFDQIDRWIELLQSEFGTGRTELLEQALQNAKETADGLREDLAALPDPDEVLQVRTAELSKRKVELADKLSATAAEIESLEAEVEGIKPQLAGRETLRDREVALKADISLADQILNTPLPQLTADVQDLAQQKAAAERTAALWTDYAAAKDYAPASHLPMTRSKAEAQLKQWEAGQQDYRAQEAAYIGELRTLRSHLHTELSCPTCKRAWDNVEQMQQANAETERKIAETERKRDEARQAAENLEPKIREVRSALQVAVPETGDGSRWQWDNTFCPPKAAWQGEIPQRATSADVQEIEQRIYRARLQREQYETLSAKHKEAEQTRAQASQELQQVSQRLSEMVEAAAQLDVVEDKLQRANYQATDLQRQIQTTEREQDLEAQRAEALRQTQGRLKTRLIEAEETVARQQAGLDDMRLNNHLLKALRGLKPQIADNIWQTLCATISNYFSLMRGQQSVVAKTSDGFTVDGNDISSLSGSTLDILGIAVRVALTRTFIPDCRFLFLDEPFAACDAQRQSQALGFIAASGFEQILVVTHEDVTETVAGQLVEL